MILDTNFLIAIDEQNPDAIETAREIEARGVSQRLPRVVITELWASVGKGDDPAGNRQKFTRLIDGFPQLDLTTPIAKRAGEIEGKAQAQDTNDVGVGIADAVIASTAIAFGEPIVTNDRTDFVERIQGQLGYDELAVELY
jgi:predicted nucleic acid-binding protein